MFLKNKLNLLNSQNRHVHLEHLSTNDTGLQFWGKTRFTVMSSGEVVVWGKTSDEALHKGVMGFYKSLFKKQQKIPSETPPAFHIFSPTSTGWKKLREVERLCDQDYVVILPVNIKNKEQLAVSCWHCQSIKLYNLDTLQVTTAFHNPKYRSGCMCHGENGKLYVVPSVKGDKSILELDFSEETFSGPTKTVQSGM